METIPHSLVVRAPVFRNVQALRALAAVLVVFEHMGNATGIEAHYFPAVRPFFSPFTYFGLFGVDLFFAISGFIMITTTWESFGRPGAGLKFFLRRCVRIYPPYWLVLVPLTYIYVRNPERFTQFHSLHTDLLSSYLLLPHSGQSLLAVSWTLVYEVSFYVVFALLLFLKRRFIVPAIAIWFVLEIAAFFVFRGSSNAFLEFLSHPSAIEFIFGSVVGMLYVHKILPAPRAAFGIAVAAFVALWSVSFSLGEMPTIERVFVFGIPAALIVYGVVAIEAVRGAKAPAWAVSIGDSSYALYLWHLPVLIAIAQIVAHLHPHGFLMHVLVDAGMLGVLFAYSAFIYRFVERPMTTFLNRQLVFGIGKMKLRATD
jgi:peptidoglycan/LPS O-acetylase OafA/YrhL